MDCCMIQASIRIVAPSGKREEFLEVLRGLKGPTEVTRGCRACRVSRDVDDESAINYLVQWESRAGLEEYLRSERFRQLLPYIEMSTDPPEVEVCTLDPIGGIEILVAALG
jgi:quinol monooxygenase YgiN